MKQSSVFLNKHLPNCLILKGKQFLFLLGHKNPLI